MKFIYLCKVCERYSQDMDKWTRLGKHGMAMLAFPENKIEMVFTICEGCEQAHRQQLHLPIRRGSG